MSSADGAPRPTVAIVSVNFNQTALTREMLASLEAAGLHTWCEVWVVDNASDVDGSPELSAAFPWVRTLRSEVNLGFAGGNNLAVRHTDAAYVFLLNNDALVDPGVLEGLLARFGEHPRLGALSPLIYDYPQRGERPVIQYAGATAVDALGRNTTLHRGEPAGSPPAGLRAVPHAHGAALLVSREALDGAGLMDEGYFLYYEELDWCERIRRAGFDVMLDGDRAIWHRESVSTGADSAFKTYWINRSRIRFMRRNAGRLGALAFHAFYLLGVLPFHGGRHFLAGRRTHARALWRALADQAPLPPAPPAVAAPVASRA